MKDKNNTKIKKEIINYSTNTLNMEKEREKQLYQTANSIITCISILIVAIMSLIFELLDRLKDVDYLIVIFGCILILLLLVSLFFSIKAHWFYKKKYTRSGQDLIKYINEHKEQYLDEDGFLDQKIHDIDQIYISLEKDNNLRLIDLIIASILLYMFLGLILIFSIVIIIIVI